MSLSGKIALVTGCSRGLGKGIAIELGRAKATVYITGRPQQSRLNFPNTSTLDQVAEEITKLGGKGIAVYCDHENPAEVKKLFERIEKEQTGRLDILVNNAYSAVNYIGKHVDKKFFQIPDEPQTTFDWINNCGLRNHYVCSYYAAKLMSKQKSGLIVVLSSPGAISHLFNIAYGVGKAACDKMASDIAHDMVDFGVTSISLWPGAVKTEIIEQTVLAGKGKTDASFFENAESIYFAGKCIVSLATDPKAIRFTGRTLTTAELADTYELVDIDGAKPKSSGTAIQKRYLDTLNAFRTHNIKPKI
ncbi:hypothetical protein M3Y94_01086800 [Aphelenchoides besseyi]|nr:hypothetical protein M3Y94_01086800 [Aphelenchoides besseyi]